MQPNTAACTSTSSGSSSSSNNTEKHNTAAMIEANTWPDYVTVPTQRSIEIQVLGAMRCADCLLTVCTLFTTSAVIA
jgi:hypothetical protein